MGPIPDSHACTPTSGREYAGCGGSLQHDGQRDKKRKCRDGKPDWKEPIGDGKPDGTKPGCGVGKGNLSTPEPKSEGANVHWEHAASKWSDELSELLAINLELSLGDQVMGDKVQDIPDTKDTKWNEFTGKHLSGLHRKHRNNKAGYWKNIPKTEVKGQKQSRKICRSARGHGI